MTVIRMVCEGACNPDIAQLDRAIAKSRKPQDTTLNDWELLQRVRALKQTRHQPMASSGWYRCTVCGAARRCGGTLTDYPVPISDVGVTV